MPEKILIVEDDDDIRELLMLLLEFEGFQVESARDGLDALDLLKNNFVPAMIFLDLMMPRLDGEGLLEIMSQNAEFSKIPVVIMSGQVGAREKAKKFSCAGCLIKPVDVDQILQFANRYAIANKVDEQVAAAEL